MLDKETKLHGIRLREAELSGFHDKYTKLKARYDAFYTAYGLLGDALESPETTTMEDVDKAIIEFKEDLEMEDLQELRKLREFILNDFEVAIKEVFPDAKEIESII